MATSSTSKSVITAAGFVGGITGAVTGNVTGNLIGNLTPAAATAAHGAGAIGTGVAPVTTRWTENGVIVTRIKIDLQGLTSKNTANDVIGLAAGGAAYIGKNNVALNGIIFKAEISCIEATAGGDDDVNVVAASSGTLAYDDAGGTTYVCGDVGNLAAGKTVQNLAPSLTADHYFYLTAGTGDTAAAYTAGQVIITLWGHPVLT